VLTGGLMQDTHAGHAPARQSAHPKAARIPLFDLAVVGAGGALGSTARYLAGLALPAPAGLPWPTFAVNISGSFLLGLVMVYLLDVWPPRRGLRLFLTAGLIGGYTTFSAYTAGVAHLIEGRAIALADAYALTSLAGGVAAVWCGVALAARLANWPRRGRRDDPQ